MKNETENEFFRGRTQMRIDGDVGPIYLRTASWAMKELRAALGMIPLQYKVATPFRFLWNSENIFYKNPIKIPIYQILSQDFFQKVKNKFGTSPGWI